MQCMWCNVCDAMSVIQCLMQCLWCNVYDTVPVMQCLGCNVCDTVPVMQCQYCNIVVPLSLIVYQVQYQYPSIELNTSILLKIDVVFEFTIKKFDNLLLLQWICIMIIVQFKNYTNWSSCFLPFCYWMLFSLFLHHWDIESINKEILWISNKV